MKQSKDLQEIPEQADTQEDKYLAYRLSKENYVIEIHYITEIIGIQKITRLPDMPDFIRGVINLRGKVIPVIDVRIRFGLEERQYDERTCIIVVNIKDLTVGLIVDQVQEVITIPSSQVDVPPTINKKSESRYIKGLGKIDDEVKIILDIDQLLFDEELQQLTEPAGVL